MSLGTLVMAAAGFALQSDLPSLREANERATALVRTGKAGEALALLRNAVDAARLQKDTGREMATAIDALGMLYATEGRMSEAVRCHREAILILEHCPDGKLDIGRPLINLGRIHLEEGRVNEAERLLLRADEALTATTSLTSDLVMAGTLLARVNIKKRRYREAEQYAYSALQRLEGVRGLGWYQGLAWFQLANAAHDQGRIASAESFLRRAIAAWEESLGRQDRTCVSAIARLAILISNTKPDEAESLFREISSPGQPMHPELSTILGAYARFLRSQGRKREGKAVQQRAKAVADCFPPADRAPHTVDLSTLESAMRK